MRRRILLTIVAVTLTAVCAFFVPAALAIRSSTRRGDSLDVERDAAIVASQIPPVGPVDVAEFQHLVGAERQLGVYDSASGLVDGVGPDLPDVYTRLALAGEFAEGWSDGNLVAAVPVRNNTSGPSTVVRIEEPASVSRVRIERSLALLALIGAGIVGAAAMIGVLLTRRLTSPIERLTTWATHAEGEPAPPPATTGIGELDELRDALVEGRERVDDVLARERSFSSHVSHQLRTPVAALRAAIETELAAPRPDPTSLLHEGLGAVDRLEATITSLLALARRAEGEPVLCDAAAIVADQVERWRPTLAAHGRDIGVEGAPLIISTDPATIRHIVDVLIENAFRHGSGMIDVRIDRGSTDVGRRELVIDVCDDGAVAAEVDPFTAHAADSGRGIGLRLARTLAESSGGCLELQAASPTRFRLRLPERGGVYPTLTSA